METSFLDHFSQQAKIYAAYRPGYPETLFQWLASQNPVHDCVWDCGTGNGQAATVLARYFKQVVATDASAAQIAAAPVVDRVEFRVAPAERSGLPDHSVDLITVAQALHWFDLDAFYAEAKRVLKDGGVLAAWTYGVIELADERINPWVQHFYYDVVGPYWPPERRHVETGYRDLPFPFSLIDTPAMFMEERWPLAALGGYLRSWSATQRYANAKGEDPVAALESQIKALGVDADEVFLIRWPLSLRVGRSEQRESVL